MSRTRRGLKRSNSLKRMLIRESIFSYVVRKQEGLCWYCNDPMGADCTKEHLYSQCRGGTDSYPRGNLKATHSECNMAVGHLPVKIKLKLRTVCLSEGRAEMFRLAMSLRRAQTRAAFLEELPYESWT